MKTVLLALTLLLPSAAFTAENPVVNLTVKDGHFTPETLEIPAGQKVQLLVKNDGTSAEEFESVELNRERVVPAGKSITVFLGPLDSGVYTFFGDFHPDTAKGKIIVK
ncbi:MAG: cupredoxin domain-containing protein [Bdellovibrionota bacterium]